MKLPNSFETYVPHILEDDQQQRIIAMAEVGLGAVFETYGPADTTKQRGYNRAAHLIAQNVCTFDAVLDVRPFHPSDEESKEIGFGMVEEYGVFVSSFKAWAAMGLKVMDHEEHGIDIFMAGECGSFLGYYPLKPVPTRFSERVGAADYLDVDELRQRNFDNMAVISDRADELAAKIVGLDEVIQRIQGSRVSKAAHWAVRRTAASLGFGLVWLHKYESDLSLMQEQLEAAQINWDALLD